MKERSKQGVRCNIMPISKSPAGDGRGLLVVFMTRESAALVQAQGPSLIIKSCDSLLVTAPREEKTWTVHSSCKLPPEPKARVANRSCGLANFIPVVRILFFAIPGPKHHIPVSEQGGNVTLSARVWQKNLYFILKFLVVE